jgi:hypothetical protein
MTGPIKIKFQLKTRDLTYPDDYITITFFKAMLKDTNTAEPLCFFTKSDLSYYMMKSPRCEYDTATP